MQLYNTLTRQVERVVPRENNKIGLYACGITAYDYAHIGNLRRYVMDDVLVRTLRYDGYQVNHVQNVTDVGHLVSDADDGEDKLELGAKKYGKSAWDIATYFEKYFFAACGKLNMLPPTHVARATAFIDQQIHLAKTLEDKGYAYIIPGEGLYFDTSKFPEYANFAGLKLTEQVEGARVSKIMGRRHPSDFALWKFEREGENREMNWSSPWSEKGFPGWHLECVAIARHFLGEQFDIHTGGIDHIPVHHTNEIAEAQCAFDKKPYVRYWVHHNHMLVDGQKMSKSLGNVYKIEDLIDQGFSPSALRYLYLTAHYQSELNFTLDNLRGVQKHLNDLVATLVRLKKTGQPSSLMQTEHMNKLNVYRQRFLAHLNDNLNTPQALTIVPEVLKTNLLSEDKYDLVLEFDEVLGLGLRQLVTLQLQKQAQGEARVAGDPEAAKLLQARQRAKADRDYVVADEIRTQLFTMGYQVVDTPDGGARLEVR
jgi:cysteinyl-tRNA synthetase